MELPKHFFKVLTALLVGTTYLSAFEGGKPTCNRFIINYFLYLLTSFSIYFTAMRVYEEQNLQLEKSIIIMLSLALFALTMGMIFIKNKTLQHLMFICILLILAYKQRFILKDVDKEVIEDALKKMMVIIVFCVIIALKFPHYMNDSFLVILFFALIFVVLFRIIDVVFFDKKYHDIISTISVFLFSCLIMYDTNRVVNMAKECRVKGGTPNYLDHVLDMFLNLFHLFNNLTDVLD
jgi:FtsH-binding integral membrane protein